jgi:iron complex outermembrane receptor protein
MGEGGNSMHKFVTRLLASAGATALVAGLGVASAQEAPPAEEEIVVTATKRDERVQDVPVAVTSIGGEQVAAAGVNDTERLAQVVPSLFVTSSQQVGLADPYAGRRHSDGQPSA